MSNDVDFIDGKMVDWDNISISEIEKLRDSLTAQEKKIREKINDMLKIDEDD